MNRFRSSVVVSGCCALAGLTSPVCAERDVVVNGQRLSAGQVARLDAIYCGRVPDGNYWFSERFGIWGYAGNPAPRGRIDENCRRGLGNIYGREPEKIRPHAVAPNRRVDPDDAQGINREESDIGTTFQPHAPPQPSLPQGDGS